MTDTELMSGLRSGDEAAFAALIEGHQDQVYNTALGMLQSLEEAEDITQDVFIQVYESINLFRGEAKLSTWLYRITVSKCLDRIKYNKRKKRGGHILSLFTRDGSMHDLPDFYHPGVQADNKELAAVLFKAMARLPEKQKVAFTLSKVEGLSQMEIATVMNCSEGAVEGYMHRAKEKLRKLLSGYYNQ